MRTLGSTTTLLPLPATPAVSSKWRTRAWRALEVEAGQLDRPGTVAALAHPFVSPPFAPLARLGPARALVTACHCLQGHRGQRGQQGHVTRAITTKQAQSTQLGQPTLLHDRGQTLVSGLSTCVLTLLYHPFRLFLLAASHLLQALSSRSSFHPVLGPLIETTPSGIPQSQHYS